MTLYRLAIGFVCFVVIFAVHAGASSDRFLSQVATPGNGSGLAEEIQNIECSGWKQDCRTSGCCANPSLACYEKNEWWAECRTICKPGIDPTDLPQYQTPWSCNLLKMTTATTTTVAWACAGLEQDCRTSKCCANPSHTCFEKNAWWGECKASCTPGINPTDPPQFQTPWSCDVMDIGMTTVTTTASASACTITKQDCRASKCCANLSFACYEKNMWWAECRSSCTPGIDATDLPQYQTPWSCSVLKVGMTTTTTTIAPRVCAGLKQDCRTSKCCANPDFTCYEKDAWWSECRASCRPGIDPTDLPQYQTPWNCTALSDTVGTTTTSTTTTNPGRKPGGLWHAQWSSSGGGLTVSTVELGADIAGPLKHRDLFRGPSPMNPVADPKDAGVIYFSWSENLVVGETEAGDQGRIHITKVRHVAGQAPSVEGDVAFDGFAVSGGIDITEDGIVGTLCAKLVPQWYREFVEMDRHNLSRDYIRNAPMMLAVCEADSKTMTAHGTPWRIGVSFVNTDKVKFWGGDLLSYGPWGNYPIAGWFEQNAAGYGHLTYASKNQGGSWTAWYGATIGSHTGYEQHTYNRTAAKEAPRYPVYGSIPETTVEHRIEQQGAWTDSGQGDHQAGSAARYHPLIGDIFMQKHKHGAIEMFQYGFADIPDGNPLKAGTGNLNGGMTLAWPPVNPTDFGRQEGSMRPCGDGIITAFVADGGHTCAVISKEGQILKWVTIEKNTSYKGSHGSQKGPGIHDTWIDSEYLRMTRLATLGSPEAAARCGSDARFLMGYETAELFEYVHYFGLGRKRFLVELDGNCNKVTDPMEVTEHNLWPMHEEWTTTQDGAVVWVTAYKWHKKLWNGGYAPKLSVHDMTYEPRAVRGENIRVPHQWGGLHSSQGYWGEKGTHLIFEKAQNATNVAVLSVYYPAGKMPTLQALPPKSKPNPPNNAFKAFGWRLLTVPTKWGAVTWDVRRIVFQTSAGFMTENENCTAVAGNWYPGVKVVANLSYKDPLGPYWAFKDVDRWGNTQVEDGDPHKLGWGFQDRWVGLQDGEKEVWAGLQCKVEQAPLLSVAIEENPNQCAGVNKHSQVAFLSAWSGSEWLEVAELKMRCTGPDNPCECGGVHIVWKSTEAYKEPVSF